MADEKKVMDPKKGNRIAGCIIGCVALFVFFVIGISPTFKDKSDKPTDLATPTAAPEQRAEEATRAKPTPTQYVFDVPSLAGKNIDEIRGVLGDPKDGDLMEPNSDQKALGADEWDNTYSKDGKDLLITFDSNTRKVIDFFIGTTSERQDKNKLLQIGNLQEGNTAYKIEYVKSLKDPGQITGVKVIPN